MSRSVARSLRSRERLIAVGHRTGDERRAGTDRDRGTCGRVASRELRLTVTAFYILIVYTKQYRMIAVTSAFDRNLLARLVEWDQGTPTSLAREFGRNATYVRRRLVLLDATGHVRCTSPAREPRRYEPTAAGREAAASWGEDAPADGPRAGDPASD